MQVVHGAVGLAGQGARRGSVDTAEVLVWLPVLVPQGLTYCQPATPHHRPSTLTSFRTSIQIRSPARRAGSALVAAGRPASRITAVDTSAQASAARVNGIGRCTIHWGMSRCGTTTAPRKAPSRPR